VTLKLASVDLSALLQEILLVGASSAAGDALAGGRDHYVELAADRSASDTW